MSTEKTPQTKKGSRLIHVLTLIFIVLKLTGVISWSWWMVLFPTYSYVVFVILFLALVGYAVVKAVEKNPDLFK